MRGRFVDRDGLRVRVGDTAHAGTVDVTAFTDPAAAKALVMKTLREAVPPAGEPSVTWIKSVDVTKILGPETGASAASISRFKSASGGMEWLVARLAYDSSLVEISLPVLEGGRSIALYWIASTVRAAHDPQPAPPVDLSNRLGITFFRPPPADRTEAFYKQGDLRSKDFTMLVARDYYVNLNSDAPDAFPAKLSHAAGNALVRLDRWEAGGGSAGASEPAGGRTGFDSGRLESSIRAWLSHEGFDLEGSLSESPIEKLARQGASRGDRISFKARRRPGSDGAASRPGGAASDVSGAQSALGEGAIYEAEDGKTYLFLSLRWDPDAQERAEEIHLMMRSLRFFAKAKS
jgi:hypothetical protein